MPNLYVRNLPAPLHKRVKECAAAAKQSLSHVAAALLQEALDERDLRTARAKLNKRLFRVPPKTPR